MTKRTCESSRLSITLAPNLTVEKGQAIYDDAEGVPHEPERRRRAEDNEAVNQRFEQPRDGRKL